MHASASSRDTAPRSAKRARDRSPCGQRRTAESCSTTFSEWTGGEKCAKRDRCPQYDVHSTLLTCCFLPKMRLCSARAQAAMARSTRLAHWHPATVSNFQRMMWRGRIVFSLTSFAGVIPLRLILVGCFFSCLSSSAGPAASGPLSLSLSAGELSSRSSIMRHHVWSVYEYWGAFENNGRGWVGRGRRLLGLSFSNCLRARRCGSGDPSTFKIAHAQLYAGDQKFSLRILSCLLPFPSSFSSSQHTRICSAAFPIEGAFLTQHPSCLLSSLLFPFFPPPPASLFNELKLAQRSPYPSSSRNARPTTPPHRDARPSPLLCTFLLRTAPSPPPPPPPTTPPHRASF